MSDFLQHCRAHSRGHIPERVSLKHGALKFVLDNKDILDLQRGASALAPLRTTSNPFDCHFSSTSASAASSPSSATASTASSSAAHSSSLAVDVIIDDDDEEEEDEDEEEEDRGP